MMTSPGAPLIDLSGQRWVLLETAPWGHVLRLPGHHLARWLIARGATVAYVAAPVSPWHRLAPGRGAEMQRRWQQEGPRGRWRHRRLFTLIPRTWLPVANRWPFDSAMAWHYSEEFSRPRAGDVLREAGFDRADVVVVQNWQMQGLVRPLRPRALVVRLEDDLRAFPAMPRVIPARAHEVVREADLVTITAEALRPMARAWGASRMELLRNGVDARRFARPDVLPAPPRDWPSGPVALYTGAISTWFDDALLAAVARRLPHWSFVLVGPRRHALDACLACANVQWRPPMAQEALPPLLWHATAGIIPFTPSPLIDSVCPLKLFEYMAAGLPVVATRWREMQTLGSPAHLADTAEEFADGLARSEAPDEEAMRQRVIWAQAFDWSRLFAPFAQDVAAIAAGQESA